MTAKPIPDGYHTVTPYLIVHQAAEAIDFYKRAFGASELMRLIAPDGAVGHAEVKIGDSPIMLADESPDESFRGPRSLGGSAVSILLYVEDVDNPFRPGNRCGRESASASHRPILWRPGRYVGGSLWTCVDARDPQRRPLAHRNQ